MTLRNAAALLVATAMAMCLLPACTLESQPSKTTAVSSSSDEGGASPADESEGDGVPVREARERLSGAVGVQSKVGAVEFTKLWFQESGDALQSGDASWLRAHSHAQCAPCSALSEGIEKDAREGVVADRDPVFLRDVRVTESDDDGYRVEFVMLNPAHSMVRRDGSVVKRYAKMTLHVATDTHWKKNRWVLRDWWITQSSG